MLDVALFSMLDLSTAHLTERDADLMKDCYGHPQTPLPRIVQHAYGFIVFVGSDNESLNETIIALREEGFSDTFITLYSYVVTHYPSVLLINFDQASTVVPGFATFNW